MKKEELFVLLKENKKKVAIVSCAVLLAGGGIGGACWASAQEKQVMDTALEEIKKINPPEIRLYADKLTAGVNVEVSLQEKVIKSITSEGELKAVTVEEKDGMVLSDIKDGKEKLGVPAKAIKFSKEGIYRVSITAVDEEGNKTVMPVTFDVGKELLAYVNGLKDWTVEVGSKNVDFMKGITFDKKKVKEVKADSSKVKLDKEGTYDLVYTIKGVSEDKAVIKKKVEVRVLSKAESKKEADKGTKVVTSNGEIKKDSKGKTPTGGTSSKTSDKATSTTKPSIGNNNSSGSVSKPTGGNNDNKPVDKPSGGNNNTDKPSKPETPTEKPVEKPKPDDKPSKPDDKPSKPDDKPSKPEHTHSWQEQTKVVHHDAVTHVVNHPEESHTETIEIEPSYYIPNNVIISKCSTCQAEITGFEDEHMMMHLEQGVASGWYDDVKDLGGYWTDPVTEQRKVIDREAWSETVVDSEAYDETVVTGHKCSCGATK